MGRRPGTRRLGDLARKQGNRNFPVAGAIELSSGVLPLDDSFRPLLEAPITRSASCYLRTKGTILNLARVDQRESASGITSGHCVTALRDAAVTLTAHAASANSVHRSGGGRDAYRQRDSPAVEISLHGCIPFWWTAGGQTSSSPLRSSLDNADDHAGRRRSVCFAAFQLAAQHL